MVLWHVVLPRAPDGPTESVRHDVRSVPKVTSQPTDTYEQRDSNAASKRGSSVERERALRAGIEALLQSSDHRMARFESDGDRQSRGGERYESHTKQRAPPQRSNNRRSKGFLLDPKIKVHVMLRFSSLYS